MSDEESSDASSSPPPETLIAGRAKRANAGNRLSHLLQHLEDEDVKADLLADEQDDQQDYSASEDGDADGGLDSSDDSEDEGKEGGADELTGEKELKKQERVESKKKRKARELVRVQPLKKKIKIAEEVTTSDDGLPPSQPKKPARPLPSHLGPLRQSSRSQTIASAKLTETRIKESKKRAIRTQEIMRLAAEKKAAEAGPELTQEDRMARALDIEKENSRSLNRWEKSEQERLRLQREKLEAMRNRKLDGPLIRYWSGPVQWTWREGPEGPVYARFKYLREPKQKTKQTEPKADDEQVEEPTSESRRQSLAKVQIIEEARAAEGDEQTPIPTLDGNAAEKPADVDTKPQVVAPQKEDNTTTPSVATPAKTDPPQETSNTPIPDAESSFLDGIHLYVTDEAKTDQTAPQDLPTPIHIDESSLMTPYESLSLGYHPSMPPYMHNPHHAGGHGQHSTLPLHTEVATRVLLTLSQFPNLPSSPPPARRNATATTPLDPVLTSHLLPHAHPQLSAEARRYLTTRARHSKNSTDILPAPPARPVCAITGRQAKFRDPKTRLPYADMPAHKAIQRVMANGCAYSPLLGAWAGIVGEGTLGRTARGVPAGWWSGDGGKREVVEL